jgi:hypothetical protein
MAGSGMEVLNFQLEERELFEAADSGNEGHEEDEYRDMPPLIFT